MKKITQLAVPIILCVFLFGCEPADRSLPPVNDEAREGMEAAATVYTDVWNTGNVEALDTLVADDFRRNFPAGSFTGRDSLIQNIMAVREAYSDFNVTIQDALYNGNQSAARFEISGTQDGPWMGHPATNRTMHSTGMSILTFSNGQIQEEWVVTDQAHIQAQLGFDEGLDAPVPTADDPPVEEEPPGDGV